MKTGELVSLSEEFMVQCAHNDNDGCNGGLMDRAWTWVIQENDGAFPTEAGYPYSSGGGVTGECDAAALSATTGATIVAHQGVPQNETQLAAWLVEFGPVAIGVDATSWSQYTGGIADACDFSELDHGVLLVGMGEEDGVAYWKIKNSVRRSAGPLATVPSPPPVHPTHSLALPARWSSNTCARRELCALCSAPLSHT